MRIPQIRHLTRALAIIFGGLLAVTTGLACLRFSFAEPLARSSYDLPFILRSIRSNQTMECARYFSGPAWFQPRRGKQRRRWEPRLRANLERTRSSGGSIITVREIRSRR